MKNFIITAAAVFGVVVTTHGQAIRFGVKAALNYSFFTGNIEETDGKFAYAVGGYATIKINEKFSFQPELLYSLQGTSENVNEKQGFSSITTKTTADLKYLIVPIMFRMKVSNKVSIEAGPQVGFLLSAEQSNQSVVTNGSNVYTFEGAPYFTNKANPIDIGLNIGLINDLTKNLNAGLRYNLGFSNVAKDSSNNIIIKNSVFALSIGYSF